MKARFRGYCRSNINLAILNKFNAYLFSNNCDKPKSYTINLTAMDFNAIHWK